MGKSSESEVRGRQVRFLARGTDALKSALRAWREPDLEPDA